MSLKYIVVLILMMVFALSGTMAQDAEIKFGSNDIALNQTFRITVTVKNTQIKSLGNFPDIPGFDKRGTNTSSSVSNINGKVSSSTSTIMNYSPRKEGVYTLKSFSIAVNGKVYKSPGITIKVGPKKKNSGRRSSPFGSDPFDDFFGRSSEPQEFVEVEAEAFFALTTNKSEIYRGEGVTTTLSFYVSNKNRAVLRFHDLGNQVNEIVKLIRPENCWEENFNIDNINGVPVTLGDEQYTQYKIFQAAFFPLNNEDITFRSIPLKMIKYKVAKNPSFFGRNKEEDFQTFYSKAKTVKVKELPDHPLKESVAVGNYKLRETIDRKELNTGESFT
ncbi:MAG: BatD family protein [Cyclobacteriaceae bacterium]